MSRARAAAAPGSSAAAARDQSARGMLASAAGRAGVDGWVPWAAVAVGTVGAAAAVWLWRRSQHNGAVALSAAAGGADDDDDAPRPGTATSTTLPPEPAPAPAPDGTVDPAAPGDASGVEAVSPARDLVAKARELQGSGRTADAEATLRHAVSQLRAAASAAGNGDAGGDVSGNDMGHSGSDSGAVAAVVELAAAMHELGKLLVADDSRHADAAAAFREAAALRSRALGSHVDTAASLNNLACVLRGTGDLAEAEALHRRALAMRTALLGDSLETAGSRNNLAVVLAAMGPEHAAESLALYRASLTTLERILGEHTSTAAAQYNLANVLMAAQGQEPGAGAADASVGPGAIHGDAKGAGTSELEEAERLYRSSLALRRRLLGDEHPHTGDTLCNLSYCLEAVGDADAAADAAAQAMRVYAAVFGAGDARVAAARERVMELTATGAGDDARAGDDPVAQR